jgi:hypothetical protein
MGLFSRKQGYGATVRAMSGFTKADREQGMDLLQATEDVFVELGAPSRLGTALLSAFADGMGVSNASPSYGVLAGASLMGYACRMTAPERDLPAEITGTVEKHLAFDDDGDLNYEAMADDTESLVTLLEYSASLADDQGAIANLAGVTPDGWQAFATTATYQLHKNLLANGLPRRAVPSGEMLEHLMRFGFAIRLVDEVAREEPMYKHEQRDADEERLEPAPLDIQRDDGPPPAAPIDVRQWLSDASVVCTHDFEPYAEHVLELITLYLLEIVPLMDALMGERPRSVDDDVVVAISNARFGYALRNREVQLLGQTDYVAPDDTLATLLEERWGGEATVGTAVIFGILLDICYFDRHGGLDRLFAVTPGTTPELRREATRRWANQHFPSTDGRTGRDITITLVEHGYVLHRLVEIHPEVLPD